MKRTFISAGQLILLCLYLHDTTAELIPSYHKLYLTGNIISHSNSVFHNETGRHWQLYERGPCGKLMWMESDESGIGTCNCIQTPLGLRQLIYWPPTSRCYFQYDQGPCETKQWLIYNFEADEWQCQTRSCPTSKLERDAGTDMASLVELETDYYFVSNTDNKTCLRNQLDIKRWNFNFENHRVSRFLFHKKSGKFFPGETKGPCPSLMKLVAEDKFGVCTCRSVPQFSRPLVYWKKTDLCYISFTQGPCASGEWIVFHSGNPACRKHECTVTPPMHDEMDYENNENKLLKPEMQFFVQDANGTCYETNTKALCTNDKKLFLLDGYALPDCYHIKENGHPYLVGRGGSAVTSIQDCDEGYKWDENGDCFKIVNYS